MDFNHSDKECEELAYLAFFRNKSVIPSAHQAIALFYNGTTNKIDRDKMERYLTVKLNSDLEPFAMAG